MSMFLNDVLESYRVQGLVPRLSVASVEAKLCKVGIRLGGISKNTYVRKVTTLGVRDTHSRIAALSGRTKKHAIFSFLKHLFAQQHR